MISSGINLVMTVIGFAVSTMFIVFVCTRLICARIQLNASRRSFPIASRSDLSILERGLHGLEPIVVANFPTKKYCKELFLASEDAQCTVCLAEYSGEDMLRILPYCGHSFHVTCIDLWLQQHCTCPVCRISLREFPDRNRVMQPLFSSALRTQYGTQSCQNGLASRAHNSLVADTIQENHCTTTEGNEVEGRENVSSLTMDDQTVKDSGKKRVESPSNP